MPSVSNIQKSPSELKAFGFSQKTPSMAQNQTQREKAKDPVKIRKKEESLLERRVWLEGPRAIHQSN